MATKEKVKHPKGLIMAALSNMGERFGFYTMMAILVLFLSAKFGLSETEAGLIYSVFYFSIYALAMIGGIVADRTNNFKGTIMIGLIMMAVGYVLLAIPTEVTASNRTLLLVFTCLGLFVIALGNGFFKGNLQALVGQMYDRGGYSNEARDAGFSIFYMFINVGAVIAPWIAPAIRSWWLRIHDFAYNADLPELCHMHLNGESMSASQSEIFSRLASEVSLSGSVATEGLTQFAREYLNLFNTGFHYSFAIAVFAMLISLVIFITNKKKFPNPIDTAVTNNNNGDNSNVVQDMPAEEVRQRLIALFAVFAVVIFFWFSFHQNGLTLTYFARDFINLDYFSNFKLNPEMFQSANPFFVVFLTPLVVGFFGLFAKRGKAVTTPTKIAIGMGLAALAYVVMTLVSMDLPTLNEAKEMGRTAMAEQGLLLSPWILVLVYLILTIAELCISPLGLSFVSQVAPPKMQGIMQGAWLMATALGNLLLVFGAKLYSSIAIAGTWMVFVGVCLIAMLIMISMLGWLNRVTGQDNSAAKA
ncbi:peptide MFS transporter [Porphyromonadaceae bacterium W3.11]|nr:peptide MFS transporter [Porphyromonadaceae bacterium W3.11]